MPHINLTFMLFPVSTRYAKLTSPIFLTVQSVSQGPDNRLLSGLQTQAFLVLVEVVGP